MKKSKFTKAQIAFALKQSETGTRVEEVCRKMGISQATFFLLEEEIRWFRGKRIAEAASVGGRE